MSSDPSKRNRVLAIGDVHGCLTALKTLVYQVGFGPDDQIIFLGDLVDRGPDSSGVIDFVIELEKVGNVRHLVGNHEIMMSAAREDQDNHDFWTSVGGKETLASYPDQSIEKVPKAHWDFIEAGLPFCEIDTHFFVHANAWNDHALNEQPDEILYWDRFGDPPPHQNGKVMVCGHTAQKAGQPHNIGHAICIDTWVFGKTGWLTCLDVVSGTYWQANQAGESRSGQISDHLVS